MVVVAGAQEGHRVLFCCYQASPTPPCSLSAPAELPPPCRASLRPAAGARRAVPPARTEGPGRSPPQTRVGHDGVPRARRGEAMLDLIVLSLHFLLCFLIFLAIWRGHEVRGGSLPRCPRGPCTPCCGIARPRPHPDLFYLIFQGKRGYYGRSGNSEGTGTRL